MKIKESDIRKIINDSKSMGYDLRMADIFYTFALQMFEDKSIVYATLFGVDNAAKDCDVYDSEKKIKFLKKYIKTNYPFESQIDVPSKGKKIEENNAKQYEDISFEENKEAVIKLLDKIQSMAASGDIEKKDAVKLETDIRTKLNDKFAVSEKQDEQRIIVYKKYNDICQCGREIYRPTRDDIIEDLKKEYDLVPKKDNGDE